jgi:Tol biopolymer transport system component
MVRYAAVAVVSLLAVAAGAADARGQSFGRNKVHYDTLDFRVLRTEHFDIHYYAEEEEATRHAARMAERWYARFSALLGHSFTERQPIVLYASHPHFSQTNLTAGTPSEGTGGFTESQKSRIALPFAAGLGETDHVLGHEIAHAFQIDIAKRVKQNAFTLPLWFIEGMAEYLSLGEANAHTTMWVRDAARHDQLPALDQLDDPGIFPYRYGHAFFSYLASRYGDQVLGRVLRSKAKRGALGKLEEATGQTARQLTGGWHDSIGMPALDADAADAAALVDEGDARIHVGPALSPDGRSLVFLSERDRLSMDLFLSDVDRRVVVDTIVSTAADPHFDSLQYIHSSGAWRPTGRQFAITAVASGEPVLVLIDLDRGGRRREIALPGLSEVYSASWSPDGGRIVVSALRGGLSDLFLVSVDDGSTTRLTADVFADMHPAWSPDGRTIAFATDRFTSDVDALRFGVLQVGLLDLESGVVRPLLADRGKQMSPQWSPDGRSIYFVADRDGTSNVYRAELAQSSVHLQVDRGPADAGPHVERSPEGGPHIGHVPSPTVRRLQRVTNVTSGVSGITATSPALAVASRAGTLAYSVYEKGRYRIRTLPAAAAVSGVQVEAGVTPVRQAAGAAEPIAPETTATQRAEPTLAALLGDATHGLPSGERFEQSGYDDKLRLESVSQPFIGASTGNGFGGLFRASFGLTFGDLLRDRQLQTIVRLGTDVDDLAAQVAYVNRRGQWNWGVTAGFLPSRFYGARRALLREGEMLTRETTHLRYLHEWAGFAARYNINRAQRIELGVGMRRMGFEWQTVTRVTDTTTRDRVSREFSESPAGPPVHLAETQVAFVHDSTASGPTSPLLGQRLRLQIDPAFGAMTYADVRVDARRYFMPVKPFTIAARIEHVGRYGPDASDHRLTPLVLNLQSLVRGYDLRSFAADECGRSATACSMMDELTGSRLALMNLEVRAPLAGLLSGQLDYGRLPIEAIAFIDAGFLWTRNQSGPLERDRFRSAGAGARANIGGFVLEMTAARPFDRTQRDWTFSLLLRPGW